MTADQAATGLAVVGLSAAHGPSLVLNAVDLSCRPEEVLCLLGPSGSGKTTLLRCIAGLHPTRAGQITMAGRRLDGVRPELRRIGLVPQDSALFPHLSVARNVGYGLNRLPRAPRRARVVEMLRLVGLGDLADRMPHQLSGGEQQRVALARALAPGPELLLLDEPFSGLDPHLRADLRSQLRDLLTRTGTTALLVTHDRDEALSIADRVTLIRGGRIRQSGTPVEVYRHPVEEWVGRFLGQAVLLDGSSDGRTVRCALGRWPDPDRAAGRVRMLLRPEQLCLDDGGIPARVTATRYLGREWLIEARLDSGEEIAARLATLERDSPPPIGSPVTLRVTGEPAVFRGDL